MKIIEGKRYVLYLLVAEVFKQQRCRPKIAEIGVFAGDNALRLHKLMEPQSMVLVDEWSANTATEYKKVNSHRSWTHEAEGFSTYLGGDIENPETYDALYNQTVAKISHLPNVEVIRASSMEAYNQLAVRNEINFNYIYLDGSHQYETVLDDLMSYKDLLDPKNGCFQLNDCCYSEEGFKQNLGVLQAATKFCKMTGFVPVAAVNRDMTDVILAPANSPLIGAIDAMIDGNDLICVEVPNSLFPNLSVKHGRRPYLSFI